MSKSKVNPTDLVERHTDIVNRISETQAIIAKLQASIDKPVTSGNVDAALKKDRQQRADLQEHLNALALLQKMHSEIASEARIAAETLEADYDSAFKDYERQSIAEFQRLLETDQAKAAQEFLTLLNYHYQNSGKSRYVSLLESSAIKDLFNHSRDETDAVVKKYSTSIDKPQNNQELVGQLQDIGAEILQPIYASAKPRTQSVTHIQASQKDRDAVRDKIKSASDKGSLPTYAAPAR